MFKKLQEVLTLDCFTWISWCQWRLPKKMTEALSTISTHLNSMCEWTWAPIKATLDSRHYMPCLSGMLVLFFPLLCVCTRTEEAVHAGGETVRLIWIQALVPCRPAHCGPPRPHCNFISFRGDNEHRVASTHQTPGPPIPKSLHTHAHKQKDSHLCMCTRKHGNPLTRSLTFRTLSHTFPQSSHPPPPLPSLFSHW